MNPPLATLDDLEKAWRPLIGDETAKAELRLDEASATIRRESPGIQGRMTTDDDLAILVVAVVCAVVRRAMLAEAAAEAEPETEDVSSVSSGIGPFTGSVTYAHPTNPNVYLTTAELKKIGVSVQKSFSGSLMPDRVGRSYDETGYILGVLNGED